MGGDLSRHRRFALTDPFDTLASRADRLGVGLDADQVEICRRHFHLVVEKNRVLNLTRITDPEEAVRKLYLSSLAVFPALARAGIGVEGLFRCLDLGTGAGYPGVPVCVAAPHLTGLLIDSRGKKVEFLRSALEELGLTRLEARKVRGGDLAREDRSLARSFDLVTVRAVGKAAANLLEVKDLVTPGGYVVLMKGPGLSREEVKEGERAARTAGFVPVSEVEVPVEELRPRLLVYGRRSGKGSGRA